MRRDFLEFLAQEGIIERERIDELSDLLRGAPEPIGSIAFSYGLITSGDIDVVLAEQRREYRPYGEIAMSMGMLTREQLDVLLSVQQMRAATETAEALALAGRVPIDKILPALGRFLAAKSSALMPVECTD